MRLVIIVLSVLGIAVLIAVSVAFMWIGTYGPSTAVYPGRQLPQRFVSRVRDLGLLERGETIRYFYSDALVDIERGMYFVTDRKLVVYSSEWEEPSIVIPFDRIDELSARYDESWLEDSSVFLTTTDGMEISFPVSSEQGLDEKFVEAITEHLPSGAEDEAGGDQSFQSIPPPADRRWLAFGVLDS